MCVLIVACNLGVIEALYQMNRRSETRRLTRPPALQMTPERSHLPFKATANFRHSVDMEDDSTSTYTTYNSSLSRHTLNGRHQKETSVGPNSSWSSRHQTQEEIKFARLMAVLCIFYVLCWIPQLVRCISIFSTCYFFLS